MEKKYLWLGDCNLGSLRGDHRQVCLEKRHYVPPAERYIDDDEITHIPGCTNLREIPYNSNWNGDYLLDLPRHERRTDHSFG